MHVLTKYKNMLIILGLFFFLNELYQCQPNTICLKLVVFMSTQKELFIKRVHGSCRVNPLKREVVLGSKSFETIIE